KKLLIVNAWEMFQNMFIENEFEIYLTYKIVEIELSKKTERIKEVEE
ncbi:35416_t:CDS:2, partial [Gigaspora margarita]